MAMACWARRLKSSLKWPRAAGPFLAAAKLEVRLLVVLYQAAKGVGLLYLVGLWACSQRICVVHMSIGLGVDEPLISSPARAMASHVRAILLLRDILKVTSSCWVWC
jgi:hypothetical protein